MSTAYASGAEFTNFPTGLEVSDLVSGGASAQQTAELALILQQASSAIDQWVYQPLYAHQTSQTSRAMPTQKNTLEVRLNHFPIQSIVSAQWRQTAVDAWHAINAAGIDLYPEYEDGHKFIASDFSYGGLVGWGQNALTVQTTYIAGYPNMVLTASSLAGTTTLIVDTSAGVQVGQTLNVYDGANYEGVTVAGVSGSTVTLSAPTQYAHGVGVRVSSLPDAVSTACILMAAFLLKERRTAGYVMGGKIQSMDVSTAEDLVLARQFLLPFRRVI